MEGPPPTLTLFHTADLHSRAWPFRSRISRFEADLGLGEALTLSEVGGLGRLATLLQAERQRGPTLWLDSGDALEGAELFQRWGGRVELELLSGLGLAAMALGNHELSLGDNELGELLASSASFPVLAANLEATRESGLWGRLAPSAVVQVAGVRVGVVGVANPKSPPNLASPDNPWRLELARDLVAAVQAAIDALASRVGLVVVLSHLGLEEDHALVRGTAGIDLLLGGHQHLLTPEPEWQDDCSQRELQERRGCSPRPVPIVHSGAYGRWLSRLELRLVPDAAEPAALELGALTLSQLPVAADVPADPRVEQYLEERRPPAAPPLAFLPKALARRSALGGDSALGNLTVDALQAATAADVALMNSSGLRADLEAGPLLRSDLALAFPFDEPWRLAWLNGRVLRRGLERVALRSAQRSCESALQVAGLRLRIHCGACLARQRSCLEIERLGLGGSGQLTDDAWLLVVLPAYVTLPGGDFAELAGAGTELAGSAQDFLAARWDALPVGGEVAPCARSLRAWSMLRCREAFGALGCPLDAQRARAVCRALPVAEGGRDGRIAMLP